MKKANKHHPTSKAILICLLLLPLVLSGCKRASTKLFNPLYWFYVSYQQGEDSPEESPSPTHTGPVEAPSSAPHQDGGVYSQTVMIYLVGSDLESDYGNASEDLEEIADAAPDTDLHNIVVYAGGAEKWKNASLPDEGNSILRLRDKDFDVTSGTSSNMGDPDTLRDFINDCFETYDTDLYSLVLWDHGGGPVLGFGIDENYNDVMTLPELQRALEDSVGASGRKLEWIGFDAYLMSSLEVADALAPYASYLVASQETEPGWGWNYEFLQSLDEPDMDGAAMGRVIVDSYMDFYTELFERHPRYYSDLTLSCIDLNRYQAAEDSLNAFFQHMDNALDLNSFPALVRARGTVRNFGGYSTDFDYCMVDALHLVQEFGGTASLSHTADSSGAASALEDMVVYSRTNMENAGGISICYPYGTDMDYTDECIDIQKNMDFAPEYVRFLEDFYAIKNGTPLTEDWDISDAAAGVEETAPALPGSDTNGIDISLALTKEQQQSFASAGYYILCNVAQNGYLSPEQIAEEERADEMYLFIHGGKNAQMDENGVLHATYSNNAIYMYDGDTEELSPIPMILIDNDSSSAEKRYTCYAILEDFTGDVSHWVTQTANLQIVVNSQYPDGIIRSAIPLSDGEEPQGASKQLLDLEDYQYLSVAARCSYITRNEDGSLMDFWDWEKSGWMMGFEQDLTVDYTLKVLPIQNPENYVCMFYVKDVQGNVSYSDLIPLG